MMTKYKTKEGHLIEGSDPTQILKTYQAGSKFDAHTSYWPYTYEMWVRLNRWQGEDRIAPALLEIEIPLLARLVETGFLIEL